MKLTKVNIKSKEDHNTNTGGAHFHVFISDADGSELVERTTAEEHGLMKGVDGASHNPVKVGYTWSYTFGRNEYDTVDGELAEGEYAIDGEYAECKLPGTKKQEVFQIPKDKIVGDVLPKEEIDRINSEFKKDLKWKVGKVEVKRDIKI